MASFRAVAWGSAVACVHGLSVATHIAGDPQPPQYPVVNVHVMEPLAAPSLMDSDALTQQQRMDLINALEARQVSTEQAVSDAVRSITSKVDLVAKHLETS